MNIFLFLGLAFFIVFILGFFLEKIKIPWIFAALILGLFLSFNQTFFDLAHSANFEFMAKLGIYFLLFSIGFEFDLVKIRKLGNFLFQALIAGLMEPLLIIKIVKSPLIFIAGNKVCA